MSADGNAVLALENNNHCVLNMMSPADKSSYIMMGDPDDTNAGQIRYDNNINNLMIEVNGDESLRIDSSRRLLLASDAATGASSNADDLKIGNVDSSSQRGLTIGSAVAGNIRFADAGNDTAGAIIYYHSDNSMRFTGNGNERIRVHSGGTVNVPSGITLGQSVSNTDADNTLDDYEEGDHNTTVTMSGDTSFSYNNRTLAYTKIGRLVHVTGRLYVSGAGGSTFSFTLPFTCASGVKFETSNEFQNIRFNDGFTFRISDGTAAARIQNDGSNIGIGAANPHLNVNLTYFTAT